MKFISYTGKYPNLCTGVLTLEIAGERYLFGPDSDHEAFWRTGGSCDYELGSMQGEWIIDYKAIPLKFRKYAWEIDDIFNANVEHGCCGGCI